jgi:hypothetical protein
MPFHDAVMSGSNKQLAVPSGQTQDVALVVVHCAEMVEYKESITNVSSSRFSIFSEFSVEI